jgi:hypothetical protein
VQLLNVCFFGAQKKNKNSPWFCNFFLNKLYKLSPLKLKILQLPQIKPTIYYAFFIIYSENKIFRGCNLDLIKTCRFNINFVSKFTSY